GRTPKASIVVHEKSARHAVSFSRMPLKQIFHFRLDMKMPIQATEPRQEANFLTDLESDLALGMLRVVEAAAIAAAHTMGQGDRKLADQAATETMRNVMKSFPMQGPTGMGGGSATGAPM